MKPSEKVALGLALEELEKPCDGRERANCSCAVALGCGR